MPEWLVIEWLRFAAFQLDNRPDGWLISSPEPLFLEWQRRNWVREVSMEPKGGLVRLRSGRETVARNLVLTPLGRDAIRACAQAASL